MPAFLASWMTSMVFWRFSLCGGASATWNISLTQSDPRHLSFTAASNAWSTAFRSSPPPSALLFGELGLHGLEVGGKLKVFHDVHIIQVPVNNKANLISTPGFASSIAPTMSLNSAVR